MTPPIQSRDREPEFQPMKVLWCSLPSAVLCSIVAGGVASTIGIMPWKNPILRILSANGNVLDFIFPVFMAVAALTSFHAISLCVASRPSGFAPAILGVFNLFAFMVCGAGVLTIIILRTVALANHS
jgi:hypothetical protein